MPREIVDFETVTPETLAALEIFEPVRLVLPNPLRGGPALAAVRAALSPKGRVQITATQMRAFVDVDPGAAPLPLLALDTIVRSDAAGLERMILSVLPHVDEIVIGVDDRSDEETLRVARAYADQAFLFGAADVGMSVEAWTPSSTNPRGRIDFAAARNLGRSRVRSSWVLVVDSDEYVSAVADDLRDKLLTAPTDVGGFVTKVVLGSFEQQDRQRLARTKYRWTSATHNQLRYTERAEGLDVVTVVCDTSLRAVAEQAQRHAQREVGMSTLIDEAAKGNITALFHLAKHRSGDVDLAEAVRLATDYRSRAEPHSVLSDERAWLALALGLRYYYDDQLAEAELWTLRALLDGPRVVAFCLLGDIAEGQGDLERARGWYECACAVTATHSMDWPGLVELRFARLSGIKKALENPATAPRVEFVVDAEPVNPPSAAAPVAGR